jgi:hypothetical protein
VHTCQCDRGSKKGITHRVLYATAYLCTAKDMIVTEKIDIRDDIKAIADNNVFVLVQALQVPFLVRICAPQDQNIPEYVGNRLRKIWM